MKRIVPSDEELMCAYASGDEAAFEELFRRYAPQLLRLISRDLRRAEDAHDLVQQTFVQIHRHRKDYDGSRPLRPWVLTIALNLKREYFRRAKVRPEAELSEAVESRLEVSPHGQRRVEQRHRLVKALEALTPEQREVILLHWLEGVPLVEIAEMVGASVGAVKLRAHRAYAAMRDRLASLEEEKK